MSTETNETYPPTNRVTICCCVSQSLLCSPGKDWRASLCPHTHSGLPWPHLFRKGELDLKEQATKTLYSVIGKCRRFDLPVDMQIDLFNTMVLPILTYSCEIWGLYIVRDVELLHLKFCKQILSVHKNTRNDKVYGELSAFPLITYIKCKMIGYWTKHYFCQRH